MPINKDRSKDLPGESGYSQRDREKLMDVVKNPEKYDVDVNDTNGNGDGCKTLLTGSILFVLIIILILMLVF